MNRETRERDTKKGGGNDWARENESAVGRCKRTGRDAIAREVLATHDVPIMRKTSARRRERRAPQIGRAAMDSVARSRFTAPPIAKLIPPSACTALQLSLAQSFLLLFFSRPFRVFRGSYPPTSSPSPHRVSATPRFKSNRNVIAIATPCAASSGFSRNSRKTSPDCLIACALPG